MLPLMAFAAMAFATSCSNDSIADGGNQTPDGGKGKTVELTASFDNSKSAATRVGLTKIDNSNASLFWHKGEAIFVQTVSGDTYSGAKLTTSATTGSTTADFTGDIDEGSTLGSYAVYPYDEEQKHEFTDANALTYRLPNSYKYTTVDSKVFSTTADGTTTYPTNSCNIPMVGKIENGNITTFKHIGGLAVIRIDYMPAASGNITVTSEKQLAGEFTIADLTEDNPEITTGDEALDNDKNVTFKFQNANTGEAGVFYLPLATGDYSGVNIKLNSGDDTYTVTYDDFSVARAGVTAILLRYNSTDQKLEKDEDYTIGGYTFVDLGLPSGLLWAKTNIGATTETESGNYYAWGETATKTDYDWSTYKYGTSSYDVTKYNDFDQMTTLDKADDVAYVTSKGEFRMPTNSDFEELCNTDNCTWTWKTVGNVSGYRVTSKKNKKSIFIPTTGHYSSTDLENRDKYGDYWSSTLKGKMQAYYLQFDQDFGVSIGYSVRNFGLPIRPVATKPQ